MDTDNAEEIKNWRTKELKNRPGNPNIDCLFFNCDTHNSCSLRAYLFSCFSPTRHLHQLRPRPLPIPRNNRLITVTHKDTQITLTHTHILKGKKAQRTIPTSVESPKIIRQRRKKDWQSLYKLKRDLYLFESYPSTCAHSFTGPLFPPHPLCL